jgi:hypothetical protein
VNINIGPNNEDTDNNETDSDESDETDLDSDEIDRNSDTPDGYAKFVTNYFRL